MDTLMLHPDGVDYKFSIQLCIADCTASTEEVGNYIDQHFWGNCLQVTADGKIVKVNINTNKPWERLEYCDSLGGVFAVTVKNRALEQTARAVRIK